MSSVPNLPSGTPTAGIQPPSMPAGVPSGAASGMPGGGQPPQLPQSGWQQYLQKARKAVGRFLTAPLRWSVAGKAALVLFLFLVAVVLGVWLLLAYDPVHIPWRHSMPWTRVALLVGLVIATPIVAYYTIRMWMEGDSRPYADIDYAWTAGMNALRRSGIAVDRVPIYLLLGSADERQEEAVVAGSGMRLRVTATPEGPAALHWYAGPDGVFIFATQTGVLSALAAARSESLAKAKRSDEYAAQTDVALDHLDTASAESPGDDTPATATAGTMVIDPANMGGAAASDLPAGAPIAAPATNMSADLSGTLLLELESDQTSPAAPAAIGPTTASDIPVASPVTISARESAEQVQRLEYLCQLLKKARRPVCSLNGVAALVPYAVLSSGMADVEQVQTAARTDLLTLQEMLRQRFPVTAVVVGMEHDNGFRELVRRVGRSRAQTGRFGKRFDTRSPATADQLRAFSFHLAGAFEDWVYTLFRDSKALSRPGNTRLYALLCRVRRSFLPRLSMLLSGGFGHDEKLAPREKPLLFSGCYFAATGTTPDRQAFVKSVFDKLQEEQELVEWTPKALASATWHTWLAAFGVLVSLALAASIAVILYFA